MDFSKGPFALTWSNVLDQADFHTTYLAIAQRRREVTRERERETETKTETDRQTETDRERDRQRQRQRDSDRDRQTEEKIILYYTRIQI